MQCHEKQRIVHIRGEYSSTITVIKEQIFSISFVAKREYALSTRMFSMIQKWLDNLRSLTIIRFFTFFSWCKSSNLYLWKHIQRIIDEEMKSYMIFLEKFNDISTSNTFYYRLLMITFIFVCVAWLSKTYLDRAQFLRSHFFKRKIH